jgi:hypothetical protein
MSVRARYFNAFRIASYLLVLYTLGHTLGTVVSTPRFGAESDTVVAAMKSVHVDVQSSDCTWYGFYRGSAILVSIFFLFSIVAAWQLGSPRAREQTALMPLGWALFAGHLAGAVVAVVYFFPVPMVCASATTLLLGVGCLRMRSAKAA